MNKLQTTIFFAILSLAVLKIKNVTPLSPLEQCKQKFTEQAKQIDFSHWPTCFDASKLGAAKDHVQIFLKLYNEISPECKIPTIDNIKTCWPKIIELFKNSTGDVQASMAGSLTALYAASKDCIDKAVGQFSNLDEYVASGCQDVQ